MAALTPFPDTVLCLATAGIMFDMTDGRRHAARRSPSHPPHAQTKRPGPARPQHIRSTVAKAMI